MKTTHKHIMLATALAAGLGINTATVQKMTEFDPRKATALTDVKEGKF